MNLGICLDVPHTMQLTEIIQHLKLLVPTTYFFDMCNDHIVVLKVLSIIKPMDKLAKFGNYWNGLVVRRSIEKQQGL